jgi:ABC-2 type transport system ATP-binding protein
LTGRVEGRTFLVRGPGPSRRTLLAEALKRPEVRDGVIQGRSIRLVLQEGANPPDAGALGMESAEVTATPPRFEDAFVDLLGGAPRGESQLAGILRQAGAGEEAVVGADGLTKRFGDFTAVARVSFRIGRGEIFSLLGPNGAGKSTTFKMMIGLLRPTSGSARVAGHDLYRAAGAARARLGYMAQKFSFYGDLSVRQNLNYFAGVYGLKARHRREATDRVTAVLGLGPYLDRNAGELPLGYKQRLALACAVMHEPAVLFLDEPTSGVDPLSRREFWSHINAMVERLVDLAA